jgi:hypothetical protein
LFQGFSIKLHIQYAFHDNVSVIQEVIIKPIFTAAEKALSPAPSPPQCCARAGIEVVALFSWKP